MDLNKQHDYAKDISVCSAVCSLKGLKEPLTLRIKLRNRLKMFLHCESHQHLDLNNDMLNCTWSCMQIWVELKSRFHLPQCMIYWLMVQGGVMYLCCDAPALAVQSHVVQYMIYWWTNRKDSQTTFSLHVRKGMSGRKGDCTERSGTEGLSVLREEEFVWERGGRWIKDQTAGWIFILLHLSAKHIETGCITTRFVFWFVSSDEISRISFCQCHIRWRSQSCDCPFHLFRNVCFSPADFCLERKSKPMAVKPKWKE